MLPDDVLLAIFYLYVNEAPHYPYSKKSVERWQPLIHVCRRWRSTVFGSPRGLNLRVYCTPRTFATDMLDIWPALPLVIWDQFEYAATGSVDNITAILEHRDRICQIGLWKLSSSRLETVLVEMQAPFPELTFLYLEQKEETVPVLPDSFLGGSAPRLRGLVLKGVPFPGLPKLLLSATNLTFLRLFDTPHSGYIPPEAMVTALSTLTRLRTISLNFRSSPSGPNREGRRPPPSTRLVLPILTFSFNGDREYFEDIVARIDVPRINELSINFLSDMGFEIPQLVQFINRTPTLNTLKRARLLFLKGGARVELFSHTPGSGVFNVDILCRELDLKISSLERVCTSCLPILSTLKDLDISEHEYYYINWPDNVENTQWLELLHPFTSVKNLYLSMRVAHRIVPALQELAGGRTTEVLPTLQNIFLELLKPSGPIREGIEQFVARRQVVSHPIAVSHWENALSVPILSRRGGKPSMAR